MYEIKTVGVFGHLGMVGRTAFTYFKEQNYEVYGYDPSSGDNDKNLAANADVIFICVPTPYRWPRPDDDSSMDNKYGFDDSIVDSVLADINTLSTKEHPVAVIKSTVKIGTTDKFQAKYPRLRVLFNPEFLSEATSKQDFSNPDRQFVGYTKESYEIVTKVLHILPESPYDLICPAKEAELLKYINNIHGILEVMESNLYYDVCQKEGLDYDRVCKAMVASKWVGPVMGRHYRVIFHKGKRGIGGKCFPKDLNAWIEYCNENKIDARLFEAARDYNRSLLAVQGLTEQVSEHIGSEEDMDKFKSGMNV